MEDFVESVDGIDGLTESNMLLYGTFGGTAFADSISSYFMFELNTTVDLNSSMYLKNIWKAYIIF